MRDQLYWEAVARLTLAEADRQLSRTVENWQATPDWRNLPEETKIRLLAIIQAAAAVLQR